MNRGVRGAATVEAVILLPTLLILLLGARFVARRYTGEIQALGQARTCAFTYAYSGCQTVPAGCTKPHVTRGPGVGQGAAGLSRGLAEAVAVVKSLSSVPVLGGAIDALLGQNARSEGEVLFDGLVKSNTTHSVVKGSALLPCNEVPHGDDDVVAQIFKAVTGPFF